MHIPCLKNRVRKPCLLQKVVPAKVKRAVLGAVKNGSLGQQFCSKQYNPFRA
jgi:hypothetical protein